MTINFRNVNELWAYTLAETTKRLGLCCAVICPGSRSTPLAIAFSQQKPDIEVIPILDERSAGFFALGRAKVTGKPTVLVCTSGTAGANFYPAIIEAKESRVPLLVLTADRPQELRDCHSGQTIDQLRLYGNYPNWQTELAIPSPDWRMLTYLRQTIIHAWERSLYPVPGAVHLNLPFRDPLAPTPDFFDLSEFTSKLNTKELQAEEFFAHLDPNLDLPITSDKLIRNNPNKLSDTGRIAISQQILQALGLQASGLQASRGLIIAGVSQTQISQTQISQTQISQTQNTKEYCEAISRLAIYLNFPVLAEGLSPVRNHSDLNPNIISTYDLILRNRQLAQQLVPEVVIQIGEMPTSKILRNWLISNDAKRWIIDPCDQNLDSLHGRTTHIRTAVENIQVPEPQAKDPSTNPYLQMWLAAEIQTRKNIDKTLAQKSDLFEGKVAWLLSQVLPPHTPLFIANSMPVRDVEFFWKPNSLGIKPFFNRGANGIDGTLSTALGISHGQQNSVMLTGDLALLHDTNGFLLSNKFIGHLTIVLINNNGGGIFEMLDIAKFEPPFEELFATPQNIDFTKLCATYGVEHELISSWEDLCQRLNPLPTKGIRILEVRTNRKTDAIWRKENLEKFAARISVLSDDS